MMKSSIPSVAAGTRELMFAGGGPWCSWTSACVRLAASIRTSLDRGGGALHRGVDDDVLDRHAGRALDPLDQVRAHPPGALVGQRGDDDLVDREQLQGAERGRV